MPETPWRRARPLGLLHGGISFVTGTLWCTIAGTLFVWLPARVFRRGVQSA